jgi:apolipoprotein N-acyltransferase
MASFPPALYAVLYILVGLLYAWAMEAFSNDTKLEIAGSVVIAVLLWPLAIVVWLAFFAGVVIQTTIDALKGRL